jgi:hypothetical protein
LNKQSKILSNKVLIISNMVKTKNMTALKTNISAHSAGMPPPKLLSMSRRGGNRPPFPNSHAAVPGLPSASPGLQSAYLKHPTSLPERSFEHSVYKVFK